MKRLKGGTLFYKTFYLKYINQIFGESITIENLINLIKKEGFTKILDYIEYSEKYWLAWQVTTYQAIPKILKEGIKIPEFEERLWKESYKEIKNKKKTMDEIDFARTRGIYFWDSLESASDYAYMVKEYDFPETDFAIVGFQFPKEQPTLDPEMKELGEKPLSDYKDWKEYARYIVDYSNTIRLAYYTENPIPKEHIFAISIKNIQYCRKNIDNAIIPDWLREFHKYISEYMEISPSKNRW